MASAGRDSTATVPGSSLEELRALLRARTQANVDHLRAKEEVRRTVSRLTLEPYDGPADLRGYRVREHPEYHQARELQQAAYARYLVAAEDIEVWFYAQSDSYRSSTERERSTVMLEHLDRVQGDVLASGRQFQEATALLDQILTRMSVTGGPGTAADR